MRHREVDRACANFLRPGLGPPRQPDSRLRATHDLDLAPREADTAAERLADGLFPGKAGGIVLCRVSAAVAVLALRLRETAFGEPRIAIERAADALDLDQVDAHPHGVGNTRSRSPVPGTRARLRASRRRRPA